MTMPTSELLESHLAQVGAFTVRRALPRRQLRTVGAWCFADHMGPAQVTETSGLDVGPHPHTGLQTVTWLMDGAVLHKDSLGSEQEIRPGQLNLMTAGRGVVHAEEATRTYRGTLHGVQLWVAQPEGQREGDPDFTHHAELPVVEDAAATLTVLAGDFAGARSPARFGTELVGVDAQVRRGRLEWELRPDFEYAVIGLEGQAEIAGLTVRPGFVAALGAGRQELGIASDEGARVMLLGGVPFGEPIVMWWNFVARSRAEVVEAVRQWSGGDERFGDVASSLPRIDAPAPPWLESTPVSVPGTVGGSVGPIGPIGSGGSIGPIGSGGSGGSDSPNRART